MASNPIKKCEKSSKRLLFLPTLMAISGVNTVSQITFANKTFKQSHFPLSRVLFSHKISLRSSWLDISKFFVCVCVYGLTPSQGPLKAQKKNKANIQLSRQTSLFDTGFILWKKNQLGNTEWARQWKIMQPNKAQDLVILSAHGARHMIMELLNPATVVTDSMV